MTRFSRVILISLILWVALAFYYAPEIKHKGGITFGLIQDISAIYGFYPWDTFSFKELNSGLFPLWNPLNALGEPHLANMQTAVFYPLTWLKFLFGMRLLSLDLILLFRLYLAGIFTYAFARRRGFNFTASAVSALSFMLTGYFTRHIYMSHLNVEILIPLVMLTFGEMAHGGVKWFIASAAAVWLTIVGGFPEATFYTLLLGASYFLWSAPSRRWPLLFGSAFIGFIASLAQSLPFLEYMSQAWFYHPAGIGQVHNDIKYVFTLWTPWFFGTNDISPLVPFLTPYFGLVPLALAIGAMRKGREWRQISFFVGALLFCLFMIYGIPPIHWLAYVPPFDVTLNYKYAVPPAAFCVAILAGMGAHELLEGAGNRKVIFAALILGLTIPLAVILDRAGIFVPYKHLAHRILLAEPIVSAIFLIAIVASVKKSKKVAAVFLVVLASWLPVKGNRPQYVDVRGFTTADQEVNYVFSVPDLKRFTAGDLVITPDRNLLFGISDFRYYNPMYNKRYSDFIMRINGLKDDAELRQHFANHSMLTPEQDIIRDEWPKLAALQWWIGDGPPGTIDLIPELAARGNWRTIQQGMIGTENFGSPVFFYPSLFAHSPSEVSLQIRAPAKGSLRFRPSFINYPKKSDGADFILIVADGENKKVEFSKFIEPTDKEKEYTIPLSEFAGKDVTLNFITTPGPKGDNTNDWTIWVEPSLGDMEPEGWTRLSGKLERIWKRKGDAQWGWMEGNCPGTKVNVKHISSQIMEVSSPSCEGGRTVISYAAYPGWRALGADSEIKIESAMNVFQAVKDGGDFRLIYFPQSFHLGLWVSITSIVLIVFILAKPLLARSLIR